MLARRVAGCGCGRIRAGAPSRPITGHSVGRLWVKFAIIPSAKVATLTFDISANTRVVGLGYSYVEIREHPVGIDMRLWVLATPVDGTLINLSLVTQVRQMRNPRRRFVGLGFLPPKIRAQIMNKFMVLLQHKDVLQDVVIWSRKRYRYHPRLCSSDGEIISFRAYCAQFYPDPCDLKDVVPSATDGTAA